MDKKRGAVRRRLYMNFKKLTAVICACVLLSGCSGCSLFKPTLNSILLNTSAVLSEAESVDFDVVADGKLESDASIFSFSSNLSSVFNVKAMPKQRLAHAVGGYSFTLFDYPLDSEAELYYQGGDEENTLYIAGAGSDWSKTTWKNESAASGQNVSIVHIFKLLQDYKDNFVFEEETKACPYIVGGVESEDKNSECYLLTGTLPAQILLQVTEPFEFSDSEAFSIDLENKTFQVQIYVNKETSEPRVIKMKIEEPVEIKIPDVQQYVDLDVVVNDINVNIWFNSFNSEMSITIPKEALEG